MLRLIRSFFLRQQADTSTHGPGKFTAMDESSSFVLQELLGDELASDPTTVRGLTNHLPMALVAKQRLMSKAKRNDSSKSHLRAEQPVTQTRLVKKPPRQSMARCFTWVIGDPLRRLRVNFQGQALGQKS